ncbi:hypothetical protein HPB49_000454 [Dermacentor silvarum]|uniref:Uncharacterized protein n=1 Tax=Dermacentor silvarum TaxID=543639 RepID=A0ACB8D9I9_DERSI|nr:hypothetical protein HPB49_000454 [Dermacentor silvarum]
MPVLPQRLTSEMSMKCSVRQRTSCWKWKLSDSVNRMDPPSVGTSATGKVQVLLLWLIGEAFTQHHNQPTRAAQQGVDYRNYLAAVALYAGGYDAYASTPAQYSLGYDTAGVFNDRQFGTGQGGSDLVNFGLYGYPGANGLYRQMNYVDAVQGFRATAGSSEPGRSARVSGNTVFNAPPTVLPVPTGYAQEDAAAAYGGNTAAPNAGSYSSYGRPAPEPYALIANAFEYARHGRYGFRFNEAALDGQAYGHFAPYGPAGYAAGYAPGTNGASTGYGNQPSSHRDYAADYTPSANGASTGYRNRPYAHQASRGMATERSTGNK